jgi:hypothetical protein
MNSTAMCLLSISLTDMISKMALYNGRTTALQSGDAAKIWKNLFKLFHSMNRNKMNKLKGEIVRSTLHNAENYPDEWLAELFFMRCCLEEDINATLLRILK